MNLQFNRNYPTGSLVSRKFYISFLLIEIFYQKLRVLVNNKEEYFKCSINHLSFITLLNY